MKRALSRILDWSLYAGVAALAALFITRKLSGPSEGKPAMLFDLPLADRPGERFRLADQRGKPVLIEVFASWCGACERASPSVKDAYRRHGKGRVAFVAVSLDGSREDAARIKRDWDIPYDVTVDDGSVKKHYEIEALPTFVLVDAEGVVRHVSTGAPSSSDLERWLSMPL